MKGPENWGMLEELATLLGAATACSKPVSDAGWRPHAEHVGQTGITIAPDLYLAVGISGAIQHLAGVSASRRSEEHTSELQSLMRISYAVFCLKKKKQPIKNRNYKHKNH